MTKRAAAASEQLSAWAGLDQATAREPDRASATMRQIVSIRMPDALLERVDAVASARGVTPSGLMRSLIAAGLDCSTVAAGEQQEIAAELAALRRKVDEIAQRLGPGGDAAPGRGSA
ncbi:MAG: BrnA antitoxin family protein [Chloroflexota bacterium]|nr:BrnA antitoxin family protein [Chloroflexota bacterium]